MGSRGLDYMPGAERYPHGTSARYVAGCHCAKCRRARADYAKERARKVRAAAAEVRPSGPPGEKVIAKPSSHGVVTEFHVRTCPGANGNACVKGGTWLRVPGLQVCLACIDRLIVWNGLVDAFRARQHLLQLAKLGVGKHAVADASDVAHTIIGNIKNGSKKKIRAETERRILAVDADARADGSLVGAGPTQALLRRLAKRGFTGLWISRQLGYTKGYASVLQARLDQARARGRHALITARNAADVARLYRRVVEQKLKPPPWRQLIDAAPRWTLVDELLAEGFLLKDLAARLGMSLHERRPLMRQKTATAIERLHRDLMAELEQGDCGANELVVRWNEWSPKKGEVHVGTPKGGRVRRIPMTTRLQQAIARVRHLRGKRLLWQPSGRKVGVTALQSWLETACRRAGLQESRDLHKLRHTFCSHLVMRGATLKAVQDLAGHVDIKTTMRYSHLQPSHKAEAIKLLEQRDAISRTGAGVEQKPK